jgi:pimeloyl-ACP methyl ester carboxylesterase
MRVVYLHGFASSPQSSKAQFFGQKFRQAGIPFEAPELDQGKFEELTISGQLAVVEKTVITNPVSGGQGIGETVLMGSSLGGYLAALFAATRPTAVERLILMAPAFNFLERWKTRLSPQELALWKTRGWAPIYHYGTKTERRLGYQFLEDGCKYPPVPDFHQRALILHGAEDQVVPPQESRNYVREHAQARLVLFNSGHELTGVMDGLWREVAAFLEIV